MNEIKSEEKVVVAGIAKPKPFFEFLEVNSNETMLFSDHHNLFKIFNALKDPNKKFYILFHFIYYI